MFDNGNRFFLPGFGTAGCRPWCRGAGRAAGAAGAGCGRCGGAGPGRTVLTPDVTRGTGSEEPSSPDLRHWLNFLLLLCCPRRFSSLAGCAEGREGGLGTRHAGSFWDSSSAHCGISDLDPRRKTKLGLQCLGLLQEIPHCPKPPRIPDFLFVSSATCANSVGQGWPHKARSVISCSPGTEALGAGTKKSLSLSCAGILAINPERRSSPLSRALSAGRCGGRLARRGAGCMAPACPGRWSGRCPAGK